MDVLDEMIDEGYLFTVGVEVLYSEKIQAVARAVPTRQLLSETDNPGGNRWLAGEVAPPDIIADVVGAVAELKGLPPREARSAAGDDPGLSGVRALLEKEAATRRQRMGTG